MIIKDLDDIANTVRFSQQAECIKIVANPKELATGMYGRYEDHENVRSKNIYRKLLENVSVKETKLPNGDTVQTFDFQQLVQKCEDPAFVEAFDVLGQHQSAASVLFGDHPWEYLPPRSKGDYYSRVINAYNMLRRFHSAGIDVLCEVDDARLGQTGTLIDLSIVSRFATSANNSVDISNGNERVQATERPEPVSKNENRQLDLNQLFARADEIAAATPRGRPSKGSGYKPKVDTNVRLDADVIEWLSERSPEPRRLLSSLMTALKEADRGTPPETQPTDISP